MNISLQKKWRPSYKPVDDDEIGPLAEWLRNHKPKRPGPYAGFCEEFYLLLDRMRRDRRRAK